MIHQRKIGLAILVGGLLLLGGIFNQKSLGAARIDLQVFYTASLKGNLIGCDCRRIKRAGLVKRAYFLRKMGKPNNLLLVDAGDILEPKPGDKARADYIFQVYQDLKYDAIGLGDNELVTGAQRILGYQAKYPLMANNLLMLRGLDSGTGLVPFTKEPLILVKGKYRVGVMALLEPQFKSAAKFSEMLSEKYQITPCEDAATKMVPVLKAKKVNFTVLLYHGDYDNAVRLANSVRGIDLIVVGHGEKLIDIQMVGRTAIVSPGEEGNRIGMLDVSLSGKGATFIKNSFREFTFQDDPNDPEVWDKIKKNFPVQSPIEY
jgi:2',3'-cyclic-nucleotide 2'-phosphodiesterase (5'-nucleotidase family)